jgi:Protein of unknown function (DUF3383)
MSTIPISQIVQINPGVVTAGGAASLLSGVVLTQDASVPPGQPFTAFAATDAEDQFGPGTPEAIAGDNYFPGIVNGGQLPFNLIYARYALAATPAGSYGADLGALTLAELQALTGTLIVTTAALHTSSSIDLSAATSFATAATIMTAAFTSPDFAITYDTQRNRFLLLTTATGLSATSTDVSGTLAASVGLSQASGAYIQTAGTVADTPASAMARLVTQTANWGTFTHAWAAVIDDRLAFAQWNSGENYQFLYVGWDTDAADLTPNNAMSFGAQVFAAPYQGTLPCYGTIATAAAYMGYAASINYQITNGRTTLAFRQFNAGTLAGVSDLSSANALLSNKYTYIGAYANAANNYTIAYNGKASGAFLWVDTYLDQIYLNRELQRAFFEAMLAYNSIPYNSDGYAELYQAGLDVIDAAVTSGIIRAGVTLSNSQAQIINTQAGRVIAPVVQTRGWYLLIGDSANIAQARQNRTSPAATLWYTDGGSIQQLNVQSIAII